MYKEKIPGFNSSQNFSADSHGKSFVDETRILLTSQRREKTKVTELLVLGQQALCLLLRSSAYVFVFVLKKFP